MIEELIRAWDGPISKEVALELADFGLGKVPSLQKPEQTSPMVCGYCSTGCSLEVHLKDGAAVNLTPDPEYPVFRCWYAV